MAAPDAPGGKGALRSETQLTKQVIPSEEKPLLSEACFSRPCAGESFPAFPFPPYDIQLQLMRAVYGALENGGVGIVESPTGTVRSQ